MSANQFGQLFKMTSFGESHGEALGVVIEGCPSGVTYDQTILLDFLIRRRPGTSHAVSGRSEQDQPKIVSGVFEGKTLGTPITVIIQNQDAKSSEYSSMMTAPRIGHADDVWKNKFSHTDHRGGGRSSGRETVARVIAGAFAKMFLFSVIKDHSMSVVAFPKSIGPLIQTEEMLDSHGTWGLNSLRVAEITEFLNRAKVEGQSYGGVSEIRVQNVPKNLGQPVFHKLKSDLAYAMMSIGASVGFELGAGFSAAGETGTDFHSRSENDVYGGIRGGISTGEDIVFRVAFKPTSSILDIAKKGRHDPCIVLRALPVLEAMTWLVLADHYLWARLDRA